MSVYRKLISNSMIFAIGNIGNKLIFFLLIPLHTYYLSVNEYGTIDFITTLVSMILPIITLSIYESVLRFVMDENKDRTQVFTISLLITLVGTLFSVIAYIIFNILNVYPINFLGLVLVLLNLQALQVLLAQFSRGIGKIKIFAFNGIFLAISIAVLNVIFLVIFELGIKGYLLAFIGGEILSIFFLALTLKIYKYINLKYVDISLLKEMIKYSIPLIPNSFLWWIVSASNRVLIIYFIGVGANGLFALANKIPGLLTLFYNIFFQAWQLSAIEEYKSKNSSVIFSNVFNYFSVVLFIGTSIIFAFLKTIIGLTVSPEFYDSWNYVPFLLMGVIFANFSGFLGTNYIAAKKTNGVFKTTLIGGVVNFVMSLIFIPIFGVNGAAFSTMISFFIMWLMRIKDTKKIVQINMDKKLLTLNFSILSFQIFILFLNFDYALEMIIELFLFSIIVFINRKLISTASSFIIIKIKKLVLT
ncbi:polysaccharide biosynthesis C-terminal domain-containing protein [Exiguobacterium sp. s189]|uniref:oligosaccharide flippase family protein n=1 Tax=Exiguobacterium sp. s189 TaxID=2751263 RepID=UPI001BE69DDD|nr:polysaccharide biosynthesis C-terminal domain-containing protein [Exiguobacterium sp. s189]